MHRSQTRRGAHVGIVIIRDGLILLKQDPIAQTWDIPRRYSHDFPIDAAFAEVLEFDIVPCFVGQSITVDDHIVYTAYPAPELPSEKKRHWTPVESLNKLPLGHLLATIRGML